MKLKIKKYLYKSWKDRDARKAILYNGAFWMLTILYLEIITHFIAFGTRSIQVGYIVGFSIPYAGIMALLTAVLPKNVHFSVSLILALVCTVLYGSQIVYYFIFGTFYSVGQMEMGDAALTSFWKETLLAMWNHLPWLLILFVPIIVLCLLRIWNRGIFRPSNLLWCAGLLKVIAAVYLLTVLCLPIGGTGDFTPYDFYYGNTTTMDQAAKQFGLLTAFRLDVFHEDATTVLPGDSYYIPEPTVSILEDSVPTEETQPITQYNVLEFDFDALNGMTDDEKIIAINDYCSSLTGTNKNEYEVL